MKCPLCGQFLKEEYHKIKMRHPFGKKPNTLRNKTKRAYTYNCGNCEKHWVISKLLVECEVLD